MAGPTSSEIKIPESEQLPLLKNQAMSGSQDAALQLAVWYMKFPSGKDSHAYWAQVAAENGSMVGQFNFGILLLADESDPLNRVRARYWLARSASQGSTLAQAQLAKLDEPKNP